MPPLLDDLDVLDLVIKHEVTIEACPTSNMQTSAIPSVDAHPLPQWLRLGVKACVCTDNTLFSAVNAPQEHERAALIPGMTPALVHRVIENARASAFTSR